MHNQRKRCVVHNDMLAITERLVAEYAGAVPAGDVIACVVRCREHLARTGVEHGLAVATEAAVRVRLGATLASRAVA